ncbi:hypothetical protein [Eubacterium sp.]|uniref:hypothetical protein n=1 Tax=Eubacterium sp. TaxID=142586 RepID=UPI0035226891
MENNKNLEVFSSMPVPKAVMKNALPAMAAMLMVLVYNLADTFFIGQTHNALLVAAALGDALMSVSQIIIPASWKL